MTLFNAVPPPPELASTPKKPTTATANDARSPPVATPPPAGYVFPSPARSTPIDIDAWTISALESLSVSPLARGTRSPLSINIDEQRQRKVKPSTVGTGEPRVARIYIQEDEDLDEREPIRRPPSRRDSMRKREMLLKGTEGSRQRRRWENDRLVGVPNAQPPAPSDWQPHPTHPVHHIPYALASYWDQHQLRTVSNSQRNPIDSLQKLHLDRTSAIQAASKRAQLARGTATGLGAGEVPRDLREAAKRSQVVKGWVKDLETPIREWVRRERNGQEEDVGSDEEEIVFKGRGQTNGDELVDERKQRGNDSRMVLDSFGDVENASYKRWLTHSISAYYGLQSRSAILENPARKVIYVGLKQTRRGRSTVALTHLPRPLWEICC